jgi:hypothetical protein
LHATQGFELNIFVGSVSSHAVVLRLGRGPWVVVFPFFCKGMLSSKPVTDDHILLRRRIKTKRQPPADRVNDWLSTALSW